MPVKRKSSLLQGIEGNMTTLKSALAPHLMVMARAGSGKTTTLVEGLKIVKGQKSPLTPTEQQKAIWDAMAQGQKPGTICFVAFNKSIATELQRRVPMGCDACTMHSLGLKAVTRAFGRLELNQWVVWDMMTALLKVTPEVLRKKHLPLVQATNELVRLCKVNLLEPTEENLMYLADYFEIDLNGSRSMVLESAPQIIEKMRDPKRQGKITFDDMIWLPCALDLPCTKYDLLLVDESQDLSPCQQALALKSGDRLVLVGDDKQAIYGFAGADAKSMANMKEKLADTSRGVVELPLTLTRRCGKKIVEEAQAYVADFGAFDGNSEGKVSEAKFPLQKNADGEFKLDWEQTYGPMVGPGDMVLCRVNAPLVQECFRFLKRRIKANIRGRDVAAGLRGLVKKVCKPEMPDHIDMQILHLRLDAWLESEQEKENRKKYPSEAKLISLQDKYDCLMVFASGDAKNGQDVIEEVEALFKDEPDRNAVMFSSIHKAKGLEAKRVFFLRPYTGPCPHPMAKSDWQMEQEDNLCYVAITRAIDELVLVS